MTGTTTKIMEQIQCIAGVKDAIVFGQVISIEFDNGLYAAVVIGKKYSITFSENTIIGTYGTDLSCVELLDWVRCASELKRTAA